MFVVQKHAAHRAGLHWDFRLEYGGVLWSWAVPKGPSLDPADRRMATGIHVEDHPIDYADFEGEIPASECVRRRGGDYRDRGTWEPLNDPDDGMRGSRLKFVLKGQRLNGQFTLAILHQRGKQEAWFLIKGHDEKPRVWRERADPRAYCSSSVLSIFEGKRADLHHQSRSGNLLLEESSAAIMQADGSSLRLRGQGGSARSEDDGYRLHWPTCRMGTRG